MKEEENKKRFVLAHDCSHRVGIFSSSVGHKVREDNGRKKTNAKILRCSLIMKFVETGTNKRVKRSVNLADYGYEAGFVDGSFFWLPGR